ncbi:MAG: hypothetical protein AAFU65_03375 [Pseudomonadota bacterium]
MTSLLFLSRSRAARVLGLCTLALALCASCSSEGSDGAAPTAAEAPAASDTLPDGSVEALAETADPRTLYVLGNAYATGDGVEVDQDIAERLWRVACDKGHAYACSIYGARQIEHENYEEAARTLTLAAENGVIDAISNLIELHDNEAWPGASSEESVRWFEVLQLLQAQDAPVQSPVD